MRRAPALALALLTTLASISGLLAASAPRPASPSPLPGTATPSPPASLPAPRCLTPTTPSSYATDRLADPHGGVPQRLGLAASQAAFCL